MANLAGVILSDYLLLECIGQSSMADVYLARQNDSSQYEVAVKVFRPGYAEREAFRGHFMQEAEKIGQFDHPHILPFIEYGEGEGLLYAVTPFVKSGTLELLLKKVGGKFPAMQALPIIQQLCDAVQYAHERDVVHGNIKPANIFVANDGRMLLADFGIARGYADGNQSLASLDWSVAEYAAPEQALGLLRRSSDIYALGVLSFRLLTGTALFRGQTPMEVLLKHVRQEPPLARTLEPGISDAVDAVLRRALSKRSDDRYPSATALKQAFAAAVALAPVASPVARTVNLESVALPDPGPQLPLPPPVWLGPAVLAVEQHMPAPLQVSHTSAIALPFEFQPSAPQPPVLPEQHGGTPPHFSEQVTAPINASALQREELSFYSSQALEPVEWSPLVWPESDGTPANAADYLHSKAQLSPLPQEALVPLNGRTSRSLTQQDSPRKRKLLLPILVVVLLLLGLLGALISSFLLPAPAGGTGLRDIPVSVVARDLS